MSFSHGSPADKTGLLKGGLVSKELFLSKKLKVTILLSEKYFSGHR
jgi:hypothetical protein